MEPASEITDLRRQLEGGDANASDRLLELVYGELRVLAASYLRRERADLTLETTGLVHEAYLRLVDQQRTSWKNRGHFFGIAALAMRRVLVDAARKRLAAVRNLGSPVTLEEQLQDTAPDREVLGVDEALEKLALLDPRQARIVELRYFANLTIEETAEVLDISTATVKREWQSARAWLAQTLG